MRLTMILLTAACIAASASGNSQGVSLSMKNAPLEKVFSTIEKQAGYYFTYTKELLQGTKNITIDVKNGAIKDIMDICVKDQPITYEIIDKAIIIKKKYVTVDLQSTDNSLRNEPPPPIDVTGKVTDADGNPLAGASVKVKGSSLGTTTNADGVFVLKGVNDNATLDISFVGYETYSIAVANKTSIAVSLKLKPESLNEVIINKGYYSEKQQYSTGNVSKVTSKEIAKQPVSNTLAALQGRVPGLEIVQSTGVPGGNYQVRIRGTNSIASGNNPLYIIDGVPYTSYSMSFLETSGGILGNPSPVANQGTSPLNSLNPLDIESIEVLKDADATAIYGSRGSNGVILITTKRGTPGKTRVDLSVYGGIGTVAHTMDLLKTQQYLRMRKEAFLNDNVIPTTANARDLLAWDTTSQTDWQKELIGGTANYTNTQFSVSGGEKNTQFVLGGGYHKESTVFPGDNFFKRASLNAAISNSSLNQKFKTHFSLNYSVVNSNLLRMDLTSRALLLPPDAPALYDSTGALNWNGWTNTDPFDNPLSYTRQVYDGQTNNLVCSAEFSYKVLPDLEIKSSLGYTNISCDEITTNPVSSRFPDPSAQNMSNFSNSNFQDWIIEPQLNWAPSVHNHYFNILVGSTFLQQVEEGLAQTGVGFSSEALMKNLASATTRTVGTNYYRQYRYQSAFGRANYSFKKKYIVNLTWRRDGSSRFGTNNRYAMFGAIGSGWIFSDEKLIQDALPFLSFGKVRMSYGTSGNDQIGDYQYLDTYSSSAGQYQGGTGLRPDRLSNEDFAWETNRKFEVALETGFIRDRLVTSISFYRNRSSDQLVGFPLPVTTGFNNIQANFPATVQNTGIEIELNGGIIERRQFKWSTYFNLTIPRNKLVEFPNLQAFSSYSNTYVVGEPLSIRKLYNYTGISSATGLYTFQDVNADGAYNFIDRQTVRFIGSKLFGGFQNTLNYRSFELDILFQFVQQQGTNYLAAFTTPGAIGNQPTFVMTGNWKNSGSNATIQRFGQATDPTTAYSTLVSSQQSVSDASYIRLKNLSLSYSLPQSLLSKLRMATARFFIQGQNLLTFTNYTGLDPEVPGATSLPPLRVITAGIQFTF